ncbi:MAG: helix-turn-helix transcriptional regulator [bacterium]|nr:helix-turn-helix transcriptional regulator [bacterium]
MNECSHVDDCSCPDSLSEEEQARLSELFRLLGEPSRLRILMACRDGARCVCQLATEAGLSQSLASQHLRLLRSGGLVKATRNGKRVHYRIADEHVDGLLLDMITHVRGGEQTAPAHAQEDVG